MNRHFERALVLVQQSRAELAEKELRQSLLNDPEDAPSHALLAICLADRDQFDEATREAQMAIHSAPDLPFAHYALARVYAARSRLKEAKAAVEEAIALDPDNSEFFSLLARIEMEKRNWQAALEAADRGLEVDAEDVGCANLRAMALTKLGRKEEARELIDAALAKAPEDALSHANKGWTLLHQGKPREAMEHFREALRLEPDMEAARQGMIEALKARYLVYRLMLAYFLWMSTLSRKAQWGVILGIYFFSRMLKGASSSNAALKPYLAPVVVLLFLFVILTWIAEPLFNMLLRFNRFGRFALSRQQRLVSNVLIGCLAGIVASIVAGALTGMGLFYMIGVAFFLLTIPITGTLNMQPGWPRLVLSAYTGVLILSAVAGIGLAFAGHGRSGPTHSAAMIFLGVWLVGTLGFALVANGLAMVTVRR